MSYYIYRATNTTNNKSYIGYSADFELRRAQHESAAAVGKCTNYFHRALRKYGIDKFIWEVVYTSEDKEDTLYQKEEFYIRLFDTYGPNGYNLSYGGDGAGRIVSDATRQKMKERNIRMNLNWRTTGASAAAKAAITGVPQKPDHITARARSKSRRVVIEGIEYASQKEAAEKLNYSTGAISSWIKQQGTRSAVKIPTGANQFKNKK
jgi:group I intron endonuclease